MADLVMVRVGMLTSKARGMVAALVTETKDTVYLPITGTKGMAHAAVTTMQQGIAVMPATAMKSTVAAVALRASSIAARFVM